MAVTAVVGVRRRIFEISPAVFGKDVWDLDVDGPLDMRTIGDGSWDITPLFTFVADASIWGGGGGGGRVTGSGPPFPSVTGQPGEDSTFADMTAGGGEPGFGPAGPGDGGVATGGDENLPGDPGTAPSGLTGGSGGDAPDGGTGGPPNTNGSPPGGGGGGINGFSGLFSGQPGGGGGAKSKGRRTFQKGITYPLVIGAGGPDGRTGGDGGFLFE